MTKIEESKNLATVKQALADKYSDMAARAKSRPRQQKLRNKADRYALQAKNAARA